MIIVPAKGQEVTVVFPLGSIFTTDPYPLGDNDRATVDLNVQTIDASGGTAFLKVYSDVSNDGTNWLFVSGMSASAPGLFRNIAPVHGAFIRFRFQLALTGSAGPGDIGQANFDLHVLLDHA